MYCIVNMCVCVLYKVDRLDRLDSAVAPRGCRMCVVMLQVVCILAFMPAVTFMPAV